MFGCYELYEECRTKYGFSNGEMIPPGVEECRDLLVEAINALAPADAGVEAYAWNRPGSHNVYLIAWRVKGSDEDLVPEPEWATDVIAILDSNDYLYRVVETKIVTAPKNERQDILMQLADQF